MGCRVRHDWSWLEQQLRHCCHLTGFWMAYIASVCIMLPCAPRRTPAQFSKQSSLHNDLGLAIWMCFCFLMNIYSGLCLPKWLKHCYILKTPPLTWEHYSAICFAESFLIIKIIMKFVLRANKSPLWNFNRRLLTWKNSQMFFVETDGETIQCKLPMPPFVIFRHLNSDWWGFFSNAIIS